MYTLFDTHCHLTHSPLRQQLTSVLAQAEAQQVTRFLVPATCPVDWTDIIKIEQQHSAIFAALGIHPWYTQYHNSAAMATLSSLLQQNPDMIMGEIGLDFYQYRQEQERQIQLNCFEDQLHLAQELHRPCVIHHVHATAVCINSIKRCKFKYGGFAHAFSGSLEEAQAWIKQGFMIGIGSLLLNPQAKKIRNIAARLPLANMVLETDAPYMAVDEQHNYPANTRKIAEIVAELRHCSWQEIAKACTENALKFCSKKQQTAINS